MHVTNWHFFLHTYRAMLVKSTENNPKKKLRKRLFKNLFCVPIFICLQYCINYYFSAILLCTGIYFNTAFILFAVGIALLALPQTRSSPDFQLNVAIRSFIRITHTKSIRTRKDAPLQQHLVRVVRRADDKKKKHRTLLSTTNGATRSLLYKPQASKIAVPGPPVAFSKFFLSDR